MIEQADGALMLNMRSCDPSQKARQSAISRDGGRTWEGQRVVPELADPICQASIRRLSWPGDGKPGVIFFANAASQRREKMTVRASFDDGRTWTVSRLITAQPSAYSCLVPMQDGGIGLLYKSGAGNPYEAIVFAAFTLDWITQQSRP